MFRWTVVTLVVLASCGAGSGLEGTWQGVGMNRLVLEDGRWTLHSGRDTWRGTYRVDGDRLALATDAVTPEGLGTDCLDETDVYRWSRDGEVLSLRLVDPEGCSRNRNSVLQTAGWQREG